MIRLEKLIKIESILPFFCLITLCYLFGQSKTALADIKDNLIGVPSFYYKVKNGDALYKIARNNNLSVAEIIQANPEISDQELIYYDEKILLPTSFIIPNYERVGIVINLAEPRLYYFKNNPTEIENEVISFPIAIGKEGFETPLGKTYIANKRENPIWIPTKRLREENPELPEIVEAGPDNPLGNYAMDLAWPSFVIHGTNDPISIGNPKSHGCIRLYPEDIKLFFEVAEIYTPVRIVNQTVKVGKSGDRIYIESSLGKNQFSEESKSETYELICRYISKCNKRVDWDLVWKTIEKNKSVPVDVTKEIANDKDLEAIKSAN